MKKTIFLIAFIFCLFVLCVRPEAQVAVVPSPLPRLQFLDSDGNPLSGGLVYTYTAGTSTPLATYTDASGTIQNTNPIVLDAAGRASIWLSQNTYKMVVKSSLGAQQWSADNIPGASSSQAYRTVQGDGVSQTQRDILNLKSGSGLTVTCADNSFTSTTDCTFAVVSGTITTGRLVCGAATDYPLAGCDLTGDVTTSGSTATTIANSAVTTAKINDGAVTTAKIADSQVTEAKQLLADNTTGNVSLAAHGYVPKATGSTSLWLRADGTWAALPNAGQVDMYWSFTACALGTGQPNSCSGTATLPGTMADTGYYVNCTANTGNDATAFINVTGSLTTTSFPYRATLVMVNGTSGSTPVVYCHAHHN